MNFHSLPPNTENFLNEIDKRPYMSLDEQKIEELSFEMKENITIQPHISVINHPKSKKLHIGDDLTLYCSVRSTCRVHYQWFFKSKELVGETNQMLMINNVSVCKQGFYNVVATCSCSKLFSVKSNEAFISIIPLSCNADVKELDATDKIALLIGNDIYDNNSNLECAAVDVNILGDILRNEMNFKTLTFVNLNLVEFHVALKWFYNLCRKGCYCLFYFAGHGYASNNLLYLLPTDAPCMNDITARSCISVQSLAETLQRRCEPELTIILPDTCRVNNPVTNPNRQVVPTVRGNVVFAYATMNRGVAYERTNCKRSLFVDALQHHLHKPLRVNDMLTRVGDEVAKYGYQIVEVCHTLSQYRCLTDHVTPDESFHRLENWWNSIHETPLPICFSYSICGITAALYFTPKLTNVILLEAKVIELGLTLDCRVEIEWKKMVF